MNVDRLTQLDVQCEMAVRQIRRSDAVLARKIEAWEPAEYDGDPTPLGVARRPR